MIQAVVLAGGLGTRLRPLTYARPKPLLPIVNRPLILRVLDLLPRTVDEVYIATGYMGDSLRAFFNNTRVRQKVDVVVEERPLGTGGALKNLEGRLRGSFMVINGDVICSLDIAKMAAFHRRSRALGTISLWEVEDPTPYGMVVTGKKGRILEFLEKPRPDQVVSRAVNAGTYILEPEILGGMRAGRETSIEREIFPQVLDRGLYGFRFKGFWYDAGTLGSYLAIHAALMGLDGGKAKGRGLKADASSKWHAPFATGKGCIVGARTVIGPGTCLGDGVVIGDDCIIAECVLHDKAKVGDRVRLERCIMGKNAIIRNGAQVPPGTIIGDGEVVG
jgi:NDP-sugar pyrophosphorylase family protein